MMIAEVFLISFSLVWTAYMIRHFIFVRTRLKGNDSDDFQDHAGLFLPTVAIIIPARNEQRVIQRTLSRMANLTYPKEKLTVMVVDDGSTDSTAQIADEFARQYPYFSVIHRNPGGRGKASCLNEGFANVAAEIAIVFDADYYPQLDIIEKLVCYFVDPQVAIAQGKISVENEGDTALTRLVALERASGYVVDQAARDSLNLIPQFGGTVGAIRMTCLRDCGGWDEGILAEDTDLTFKVFTRGWRVRYTTLAESYEDAVSSWGAYRKQRRRWAYGHSQCAIKHLVPMLRTRNLNIKQKVDGLLMMAVYLVPILTVLSWVVSAAIVLTGSPFIFELMIPLGAVFLFSTVGNSAPFFEVICGMRLEGRKMYPKDLLLLTTGMLFNIAVAVEAFSRLLKDMLLGKRLVWVVTERSGSGRVG